MPQQQRQVKPRDLKLFTDPDSESVPDDEVVETTLGIKIKLRRYYYDVSSAPRFLINYDCLFQAPLPTDEEIEVEMCGNNL